MSQFRGVRGRLTVTVVALVAITAAVLGIGAYAFVDFSLHERLKAEAASQAGFDLSTTIPAALPVIDRPTFEASALAETFQSRGIQLVVDFGDGGLDPDFAAALPPDMRAAIGRGEIGFAWAGLGGVRKLIVGGAPAGGTVPFYFVHDAAEIESALGTFRLGLLAGALALVVVSLLAARWVARGVLAPVDAASRAAERIERGDYSARVPAGSDDEFGAWADRFNRMAASLDETIGRLRESQSQNRRFVADVSHELRTPLAALVAEASIVREDLAALPDASRRAGELLIADVARLRTLVDDLMELSRFDAEAERAESRPVDLVGMAGAIAVARLPEARLDLPPGPVIVSTDPRRLERIVGNLLDNAREHAPGGPVDVRLAVDGATATIAVEDRGPGIEPGRLDRIFERFYKADPSRHGGSSGLGLAIAAEHAALLGGDLRAANREGGGLRFELRLPVTESLPGGDEPAMPSADRDPRQTSAQEPSP
jgi:two-component system sensor histidine kinase MtrB